MSDVRSVTVVVRRELYGKVFVPTVTYGTEAPSMRKEGRCKFSVEKKFTVFVPND